MKKKINIFQNKGAIIDKGAIYVVVILTLLIFAAYVLAGGTLPSKLPKVNVNLISIKTSVPEPSKSSLQLYTFSGVTVTPRPTLAPYPIDTTNQPVLANCSSNIKGKQEPEMIWSYSINSSPASDNKIALKIFYTNKHALLLGSGTSVSPMNNHPADHVSSPNIGDTNIKDSNNFPIFPAIFLTDITTLPNDTSGDAKSGGEANAPDDIYGTWKKAGANNPVENNLNLGPGADTWPPANGPGSGAHDYNFTSEIIWKLTKIKAKNPVTGLNEPLWPGHRYRGQIILHDGGNPSDIGITCINFIAPSSLPAPIGLTGGGVIINPDKTINVNGKKTFPIFIYSICNPGYEIKGLVTPCDPSKNSEFLFSGAGTHPTNIKNLGYVSKFESAGVMYTIKPGGTDLTQAMLDSPAFFGSYNYDEPKPGSTICPPTDTYNDCVNRIDAVYREMKSERPGYPVILNHFEHMTTWAPHTDIISWDIYTISKNRAETITTKASCESITYYWDTADAKCYFWPRENAIYAYEQWSEQNFFRGRDLNSVNPPVWAVVQANGLQEGSSDAYRLVPVPKEARVNTYTAITMDVKGLGYWGYESTGSENATPEFPYGTSGLYNNPSLHSYYKNLARELKSLNDILVLPTKDYSWHYHSGTDVTFNKTLTRTVLGKTRSNFNYILKQDINKLYLIVVNKDSRPISDVDITIAGLSGTMNAKTLGLTDAGSIPGRTLPVTNGKFTDSFDGYGVHIYEVSSGTQSSIGKYNIYEVNIATTNTYTNPYLNVWLNATFTGPTKTIKIDGFWDGEQNWKIRMAPIEVGTWTYRTYSNDAQLNDKTGTFTVTESGKKGFIKVNPNYPYSFMYDDGTPFFWMGDTLWDDPGLTNFKAYANLISSYGYNSYHSVIIHDRYNYQSNENGAPFEMISSTQKNYDKLRPSYFQAYDTRIAYANSKGLTNQMFFTWSQEFVKLTRSQFERLTKYLIARYSAYDVVWVISGEYNETSTSSEYAYQGNIISQKDPYKHPISIHPGSINTNSGDFGNNGWLTYVMQQFGYSKTLPFPDVNNKIISDRKYNKPVVNGEGHYLDINMTDGSMNSAEFRKQNWKIVVAGGFFDTGYQRIFFDPNNKHNSGGFSLNNTENLAGMSYMKHLSNFFKTVEFWKMSPKNSLVNSGYTLANIGKEYVVYLPSGGSTIINLSSANNKLSVVWYNPRAGTYQGQTTTQGGASKTFTAPDTNDWVMHIKTTAATE